MCKLPCFTMNREGGAPCILVWLPCFEHIGKGLPSFPSEAWSAGSVSKFELFITMLLLYLYEPKILTVVEAREPTQRLRSTYKLRLGFASRRAPPSLFLSSFFGPSLPVHALGVCQSVCVYSRRNGENKPSNSYVRPERSRTHDRTITPGTWTARDGPMKKGRRSNCGARRDARPQGSNPGAYESWHTSSFS